MNLFKLIQMDLHGIAEEVDIFNYITNLGLSLSDAGISVSFINCQSTGSQPGWIGGGHSSGAAHYSFIVTLDCNHWFKNYETVEVDATFDVNAPCAYNYSYKVWGSGYGSIGVLPHEGDEIWTDSPIWKYTGSNEIGMLHKPYWGKVSTSTTFSPSTVSSLQLKGIGYDPDYLSSDVYLSKVIIRLSK